MDVTFKPADVADLDLLVEFMREFHEFDHHAFDESRRHVWSGLDLLNQARLGTFDLQSMTLALK